MVSSNSDRFRVHPAAVWLIVLLAVFATEYGVMILLPRVLPVNTGRLLEAAVDSLALTAVLAPVTWWTVVRPLREVIRLRAQFLARLFARIEADRRRTAHELHDGVGQSLSLLVSGLRSARDSTADPESAGKFERLLDLSQQALKDVRRLALGLRPSMLDDLGLAPALERLADDVRTTHPMTVTVDVAAIAGKRFKEAVESTTFRIIQEALSNVVTHSGTNQVHVSVVESTGNLILEVRDSGRGIDPKVVAAGSPGHLGLVGMRERAVLAGGSLEIDSAPGRGTLIRATIPIGE